MHTTAHRNNPARSAQNNTRRLTANAIKGNRCGGTSMNKSVVQTQTHLCTRSRNNVAANAVTYSMTPSRERRRCDSVRGHALMNGACGACGAPCTSVQKRLCFWQSTKATRSESPEVEAPRRMRFVLAVRHGPHAVPSVNMTNQLALLLLAAAESSASTPPFPPPHPSLNRVALNVAGVNSTTLDWAKSTRHSAAMRRTHDATPSEESCFLPSGFA